MSKDKLTDYSATNGSNTDVGGINIDEGMLPSAVNNSIRELMTHQKEAFGSGTPLYVDQTNNRVGVGNSAPSTALEVDADGATVLTVDRATSDGTIIDVQKDGTTVGKIGSKGGDLTIGTGAIGVRFEDSTPAIVPFDTGTLGGSDNDIDLGKSSVRWNDLYLGGNLYIGGTGSANALSDYEEGTFTPSFSQGASGVTYSTQSGHYVKVGKLVHIAIYLDAASTSGTTSDVVVISGLPFATAVFPPLSSFTIGYANNFNPTGNPLTALGNSNNTTINLYEFDGTNLLGTETNFLHDLYISGSYVAF